MIKNLIINKEKIIKNGKYKFFKLSVGALAIVSSISMFLSGCAKKPANDHYYFPESSINYGTGEYDALNDPLVKIDDNDYTNSEMVVSAASYNEFINYINNIKTVYNYESYYNVDAALAKYNQVVNNKVTSHSHSIEKLDVDTLLNSVKQNNKIYMEQKKQEYVSAFYEEFSDSELREYCSIILEAINHYNSKGLIEDINGVKCILGDLKILKRTTLTNAYVTDDNALIISPTMIETLEIKNLDGNQDVVKSTIGHEAIHLLQKNCVDNSKSAYAIGNSYEFEDLSVNPLFYNWFYEGAAEMLANNYMGYKPLVYEYYVNYINSLKSSVVLNKNIELNQVEQSTLSNSLEPLFKAFNCKDYEDKKEVINMLFSLDIIETDTQDFKDAVNPNMTEDELVKIKRNLKSSICETLTKYFYSNLATLVKEDKIPLNDVFYYITIFEADVDSHITYSNLEKYNDSIVFIENYLDIQNNFFKFLASSNKYTQEEIEKRFDEYGLKTVNGSGNFSLKYLEADKKEFLNKLLNTVYDNSTEQIKDVYARNTEKSVKK